MKFLATVAFFLLQLFIISQSVSAHAPGFPPFFKIDGEIAESYFLAEAGVYTSELAVPQDLAGKNYLVNESIQFEIDLRQLEAVFPLEVLEKMKFNWDFGDGTKGTGFSNTHSYQEAGSFILSVFAEFSDKSTPPQLIETVLIHAIPDENYTLPNASIRVNGMPGTRENYNIVEFDLAESLEFDGSKSGVGTSKIVKYEWDFGDDKSAEGEKVRHRYELPQAFATVLLRVTDENGLINDAIVNVRNSGDNEPNSGLKNIAQLFLPAVIVIAVIGGGLVLFGKKKKSSKTK